MHRERLSNVSPLPILTGWIIALAATSVLVFLLAAIGWMSPAGASTGWAVVCVAVGFFLGGYLTGTRDIEAPVLHGVGIGLTTLLGWLVLNLLATLFLREGFGELDRLPATTTAGLLLLQMGAAVAGAWIADRRALRGANLPGDQLG